MTIPTITRLRTQYEIAEARARGRAAWRFWVWVWCTLAVLAAMEAIV